MTQKIKDNRKYINNKRELNIPGIQARFNNHQKIRNDEVDKLFNVSNLTDEQYRWLGKGYRNFVIFDIESINFDARMGFIICWYALKWDLLTDKKEMIYDQLEPKDMKDNYKKQSFNFDARILGTLSDIIKDCDVLVGHYISKFDVPYWAARCHLTKQHDLVPDYMDCRMIDTWRITKMKYNLYNSGGNSLRNAGVIINGENNKTSVDLQIWKTIYYVEHPKWRWSRKYICDHCEIDVYQNFELFKKQMRRINAVPDLYMIFPCQSMYPPYCCLVGCVF